jgi:hypothetical protein
MILRLFSLAAPLAVLAACGSGADPDPSAEADATPRAAAENTAVAASEPPPPHLAPDSPPPAGPAPLAASLIRAEWSKAENRPLCAPLAFTTDGGAPASARRANFAGGWAVAFDTPQLRSAYGVAGPGVTDADAQPPSAQAERLGGQWPYFTTLPALPAPAFAGYGLEGAEPYPADNPGGAGLHSLAYVRVGEETCTYNVWSRISRAHLEALLESLRQL